MIDAGVHHLGQHQFRRRRHLLHADGHVLDGVVLAVMREFELPEAADAEIDVGKAAPSFVAGAEQRRGVGARAVADPEGRRDRAGDDPLQVALVDLARRMSAGADPVREHMGMAIDDHVALPGPIFSPPTGAVDCGRRCALGDAQRPQPMLELRC